MTARPGLIIKSVWLPVTCLLLTILITGCSKRDAEQPSVSDPAAAAARANGQVAVEKVPQTHATVSELAGTSWQLVKIMGMDDSVDAPDDRSLYTLSFDSEGGAAMQADCNRGKGSWMSESAGQLRFGPIAGTRALCPPESISEKYLSQFEWVRSYVLKNGHLFLATMADGSIIEFEPASSAD